MSATETEPQEGSSLYYSLLWTEPAQRRRLLERRALVDALATALEEVSEPAVAERKIRWWHEEIERLVERRARHPAAIACQDALGGLDGARAALLELLSVAATERFEPPADEREEDARHLRDHGARLALLAHALGVREEDLAADAAVRHPELALGLARHEALARLPARLARGYAVLAASRYARHGLTPAALAARVRRAPEPRPSATGAAADGTDARPGARLGDIPVVAAAPDHGPLLAELTAAASSALDSALASARYREAYARPELAPLARLAALRAHEARLWRRLRPDLLRERVSPTPLVKLLVAWRHRRGPRRARA